LEHETLFWRGPNPTKNYFIEDMENKEMKEESVLVIMINFEIKEISSR